MIRMEHIKKSFKDNLVLKDINIAFDKDKVHALIAPNGMGKTTLISILCGFMLQDEGQITYDNNISNRDISVILSGDRNLYAKNTVYENLIYFCILKGMSKKEANMVIEREKEKFAIYDQIKNKLVESLSYGQKRIVALMSAFISGAKCIVIDEATDGLDVDNRILLRQVIKSIADGRIILLVDHNFDFIKQAADVVTFLNQGICEKSLINSPELDIGEEYKKIFGYREE